MYKISKSAAAENDLAGVWAYTLQQSGIEQADKYINDLAATFRFLPANPSLGAERHEFVAPVRFHHHGRHVIIYTVESDHIFIIRVLHDRADPARHI